MDFNRICYNCMKEKDRADGICPHCGFDNSRYRWQENELPPLTPLNGKYLVGRALGAGGFGITYIALDLNLQVTVAIKELYLSRISVRERDTNISVSSRDRECFEDNKKRFLQEARVLAMFNEGDNEGIVNVKEYFEELVTAKNIDFISFEQLGLKITLSVSEKKLKEQVNNIVERVATDLKAIDIQEDKEEILVEYKKHLNVSEAVSTVAARHKAIQAEKERKIKQEEQRAKQKAAARAVAEAARQQAQVQSESDNEETVQAVKEPVQTKEQLAPPQVFKPTEAEIKPQEEKIFMSQFKVYATLQQFRELTEFMKRKGIRYGK